MGLGKQERGGRRAFGEEESVSKLRDGGDKPSVLSTETQEGEVSMQSQKEAPQAGGQEAGGRAWAGAENSAGGKAPF